MSGIKYGPREQLEDAAGEPWETLEWHEYYHNSSNMIAALKELYSDDADIMKNIIYAKNPLLKLITKETNNGQTSKETICTERAGGDSERIPDDLLQCRAGTIPIVGI